MLELGADSIVMSGTLFGILQKYNLEIKMIQLFEELPDIQSLSHYIYHEQQTN